VIPPERDVSGSVGIAPDFLSVKNPPQAFEEINCPYGAAEAGPLREQCAFWRVTRHVSGPEGSPPTEWNATDELLN